MDGSCNDGCRKRLLPFAGSSCMESTWKSLRSADAHVRFPTQLALRTADTRYKIACARSSPPTPDSATHASTEEPWRAEEDGA